MAFFTSTLQIHNLSLQGEPLIQKQ